MHVFTITEGGKASDYITKKIVFPFLMLDLKYE